MLLNVESDVASYLRVLIDTQPDNSIIMCQEGLAKQVVEALFLDTNNPTSTMVRISITACLLLIDDGELAQGFL